MLCNLPTTLLPYSGDDLHRVNLRGSPHTQRSHARDKSQTKVYAFNSLGFRSPEFDPTAKKVVFGFGESHAFGSGLNFHEIWMWRLTSMWAKAQGIVPDDVCLLNFSEHGASNDYIARLAISQCSRVRPDLLLINFSVADRTEGFADDRPFKIGPWILDKLSAKQIRTLDRGSNLYGELRERVRRAKGYYDYYADSLGFLNTLRNILLVQFFAKEHGIRAVATCNEFATLRAAAVRNDETLAPLLNQIDPQFLCHETLGSVKSEPDFAADGLHHGPRKHRALAQVMFNFMTGSQPVTGPNSAASPPDSKRAARAANINNNVRSFYEELPFNFHDTVRKAVRSIRSNSVASMYPDLAELLGSGRIKRVIEFGCGAGWFANTMAHEFPVSVTAVDFSTKALKRAREVTQSMGLADRVRFVESNIFDYWPDTPHDLVVSLGVLHHTHDAKAAFKHVLQFAKNPGHAYIGLYHEYARRAFLGMFRELIEAHGEAAALERYRSMDAVRSADATHLQSWFRDQVLHPHETQHTLEEIVGWLNETDYRLQSTSINRFEPIDTLEALFVEERKAEGRSIQANQVENRYLPGFFTVLAKCEDVRGDSTDPVNGSVSQPAR